MSSTPEEVATRLFAAMSENDMATAESLYADDFKLWHSFDKQIRGRAECLAMVELLGRVATRRYRLLESLPVGNRVSQRYELTLNAPGIWTDHHIDLAVFLTVVDGKIVWMEEYIDSRDAGEAMAAVKAAGFVPAAD